MSAVERSLAAKPFWQSKTFWANVLLGVGAFVPAVQKHLTPEILGGVFTGVNILLRFVSNGRVTLS